MNSPTTAASRYEQLASDRLAFLNRGRDAAKFTIPSLLPPEGHVSTTPLYTPYQSLGARGVNNLASKLILALLPPTTSFFRLSPSAKVEAQLDKAQGEHTDFEEALGQVELRVNQTIEKRAVRVHAFEGFKHLIVAGNVLLHCPTKKDKGNSFRVFPLSQFVTQRDPEGNVLEIIVKETIDPRVLPASVREVVAAQCKDEPTTTKTGGRTLDLYTHVCREDGEWRIYQECKGVAIPESFGTYPLDKCPWLPLRWTRIDGENYGRGMCEEYIGDLISLEGLSKAIVDFAGIASKIIFLVNPNGMTNPADLAEARTGDFKFGIKDEVTALGLDKFPDFQVMKATADDIKQSLSYAFLLNSSVQRQGERVTAEEIRYMANELEDALGGVYSVFSQEFQLPLVKLMMTAMEQAGELPSLPKDTVSPTIITGLDALGRGQELMRLDSLIGGSRQVLGDVAMRRINDGEYMKRRAVALGIKLDNLFRTDEELAAQDNTAMQRQMVEKLGPAGIQAGAKMMTQQQATPQDQPQ